MTGSPALHRALAAIDGWGAEHAAAAVLTAGDLAALHGDDQHPYRWASVTKLVTALAVLVATERGVVELDEAARPPGSTVRHLLAHASGLPFEGESVLARPGARRIYSNPGFDRLGELLEERTGQPIAQALSDLVLAPLGMSGTTLVGRPSDGLHGPLADLVALARELVRPTLIGPESFATATGVAFPGLPGVVPGVGRFDPCDWGLGFELKDGKAPHWMGTRNSARSFGHFGGAGTFVWADPAADVALVALTDRPFGSWALEAWPALSDDVLSTFGRTGGARRPRPIRRSGCGG